MIVFVDESGDSGMKGKQGSSKYFTITAVLFEDLEQANKCDLRIAEIRKELGLNDRHEFHFTDCCDHYRRHFFHGIKAFSFQYSSLVLNKAAVTGRGFYESKDSLYKYTSSLVFENIEPLLSDATVVFDESGSYDFQQALGKYLRERMNVSDGKKLIKKVKSQRSNGNNLIQLADMICGAVARSFGSKKDPWEFRRIIRPREGRVQLWPKS